MSAFTSESRYWQLRLSCCFVPKADKSAHVKSNWLGSPSLNNQPVDEGCFGIGEMFRQCSLWFCNSTPLNRPRANHQVARRFDERKKMCALVLTDLREVGVRMNPEVFRPRRSQQPSQRTANEQIATASGVECVTPSIE